MRDHMLTLVGRRILYHIKNNDESEKEATRLLPNVAIYSDALEHVKNYTQYREDFKEQK
jgi:hypothetical protein